MRALAITMIGRLSVGYAWLSGAPSANRHRLNLACLSLGVLLVAGPLLYMGLFRIIETDHDLHVGLIQRGIEQGVWPVHFLFPAVVYAMSGFSSEMVPLARAALVFLTLCVLAKAWLTYGILARRCPGISTEPGESGLRLSHAALLLVVTAALLVAAPIVRPWWIHRVYLGQISPNVWHNPTSLVCWPLVILLFFAAADFLRSGKLPMLAAIGALAALSVLAKPNYFLAFAPVFCLFSFWRFGLSRAWLLSQIAMLPTVAVLYWQLTASFEGPEAMRPGRHIAFMPLAAWHVYTKSITLSLLFSLAFPLSYVVAFRRSLQNRALVGFAWAVMLSALVWVGCFAEVCTADGTADVDFNFSWGAHLAIYVLFLVTAIDMLDNPAAISAIRRHATCGWPARLPWWLLGMHAASGLFWIVRQAIGRGYV